MPTIDARALSGAVPHSTGSAPLSLTASSTLGASVVSETWSAVPVTPLVAPTGAKVSVVRPGGTA